MAKAVALLLFAAGAVAQVDLRDSQFDGFIKEFGREYETVYEKEYRRKVFYQSLDLIEAENAQEGKTYELGVTNFADLTYHEWRSQYLTGFVPELESNTSLRDTFEAPADYKPPSSVDWTKEGAVTSVKDQAGCGSCWSFSTTGALEGARVVAGGKLISLSEQDILDCDKSADKCAGGDVSQAFDWVKENGVCSEHSRGYICQDENSKKCKSSKCSKCTKSLKPGDVVEQIHVRQTEGALEAAVARTPVSVAIEADKTVFQHYKKGILTSSACGEKLDHGVLVVGYGTDKGKDYWKVKNSWGSGFGEHGYIRIAKGSKQKGGECGIRKRAVFPTVKKTVEEELVV